MSPRIMPRIMIAGTASGSGKTTVTCAIMRALVKRGLKLSPFKCGPDYIDPLFHSAVTGRESGNLDTFLFSENTARYLLAKNSEGADISIIEGVMGYYDGTGPAGTIASTYATAAATKTPVLLVLNCKGMAMSAAAIIKGFLTFKENSYIAGAVLNNVSISVYPQLKQTIENEFGIKVFGMLPKLPEDCIFESRSMGLLSPAEQENFYAKLDALAEIAEKNIDLDSLLETAAKAEDFIYTKPNVKHSWRKGQKGQKGQKIKIALAKDKAFCFIYRDNINLLIEMGAEIAFFSPLKDSSLPSGISGLILPGGYPELYLKELSGNKPLLNDIYKKLAEGLPCIAECGGFMYINRSIEGQKMLGFLDADCFKTDKLVRFGYITMTAKKDNLLCKAGDMINAHEYHYFDCEKPGSDYTAIKPSGVKWQSAFARDNLYAGYPHIHFYSNLDFAHNFYEKCSKAVY